MAKGMDMDKGFLEGFPTAQEISIVDKMKLQRIKMLLHIM